MTREISQIHMIARSSPPQEAIAILSKMKGEALIDIRDATEIVRTETRFVEAISAVITNLEIIINGPVDDDVDEDTQAGADFGLFEAPSETAEDLIVAMLEKKPRTLREIVGGLASTPFATNYHGVYNKVLNGTENLRSRGIVIFDDTVHPGVVHLNPERPPQQLLYAAYIDKLVEYDKRYCDKVGTVQQITADEAVVKRMAEAIYVYTTKVIRKQNDGKRLHANRTWGAIANRGLFGAMEVMVKGSETAGFGGLAEANRVDLSAEQIVLDHPAHFTPAVRAQAEKRLAARETASKAALAEFMKGFSTPNGA